MRLYTAFLLKSSLKSFSEDGRFDVICSGSLLGVNYKKISSIPVGFKEEYTMYSLDFEEFLWANGYEDSQIDDIYDYMKNLQALPETYINKLRQLYRDYIFVGGMPEAVKLFIESGIFSEPFNVQKRIYKDYEDDITKYVEGLDSAKVKRVYRHISAQLAKDNHKFQISKIGHGARTRDYIGTEEWLKDAGIINIAYNCSKCNLLLDFFCHSVPSMWAWKKYTQMVEKKIGKITYASWRNKLTGWHDSYAIALKGNHSEKTKGVVSDGTNASSIETMDYNSRLTQGDLFQTLFLGDYCCNPACVKNCKYKYNRSSADIRIGDLWGNTYKDNDQGVSALIAFTEKGKSVVKSLGNITLVKHPFEVVTEGQMKKNTSKAFLAFVAKRMLNSAKEYSLWQWKLLLKSEAILHLPARICRKISYIISR